LTFYPRAQARPPLAASSSTSMASFPRYVQLVGHGFAGLLEFAQVDDSANIYHRFRHLAYIFGNWRRKPFVGIRIEFVKTIAINAENSEKFLLKNICLPLEMLTICFCM